MARVASTRTVAATNRFLLPTDTQYSLSFDGSTTGIQIPGAASINLSVFTHASWIKPSGTGNRAITGGTKGSGTRCPEFRLNTSNQLELLEQSVASIGTSTGTVTLGKWQHVAVTYNASGVYTFYINGIVVGTGTSLRSLQYSDFLIGKQLVNENFNGFIKNVQVFNTALTSSQMLEVYYGRNLATSLIGASWKFNEGSGTSATDSSGNANTGVITAATYSSDVPFQKRTALSGRIGPGLSATGGTITESGGYRIHTFNSSGTFTTSDSGVVDVLVVGAGGGGGGDAGRGGGGGGGEVESATSHAVTAQAYSVTVGLGGAGSTAADNRGINGGNSVFDTITGLGGGGGGTGPTATPRDGGAGGNGGGAGDHTGAGTGGAGSPGNNGGDGLEAAPSYGAGGGGSSAGVGQNGSGAKGGDGANGVASSISGVSVTYGGGGGGAAADNGATYGAGGTGGGGRGASGDAVAVAGTDNLGGGGGGGNDSGGGHDGMDGGDGVVIIRYLI